jgi:hypothetical protein
LIQPLQIAFEVDCSPDHAFETWTRKATSWWPPEHTVSHERGARIVFEPRAGGRIFERTAEGKEIEWGQIVEWDPPRRLRYLWHIATKPENATDVSIQFRKAPRGTRVEIEHGGWERLGEIGRLWRDTNQAGWDGVLPAYGEAARKTGV